MTYSTAARLINLASLFGALFGLGMVLALFSPLSSILNFFVDLAHFPVDGAQAVRSETERLLTAISGGVLVGLSAFCWQVTEHIYRANPRLGTRVLTLCLVAWCVPDSLGSYLTGAGFNVVINTGFLIMFLLPAYLGRNATE